MRRLYNPPKRKILTNDPFTEGRKRNFLYPIWSNFWYEYSGPPARDIVYGGRNPVYRKFRKQRLLNIIIFIIIIIIIFMKF